MVGRQGQHLVFAAASCRKQPSLDQGLGQMPRAGRLSPNVEQEASPSAFATAALPLTGMKAKGGRGEPRAWPQAGHQLRGVAYLSTLSFLICKRERTIVNSAFLRGPCRAQRDDACEAPDTAPGTEPVPIHWLFFLLGSHFTSLSC